MRGETNMAKVLKVDNMAKCIGCFTCMQMCAALNKKSHSLSKSAIKIRTYGGIAGVFVDSVCVACDDPACVEVCPADALVVSPSGGVRVEKSKCIGCRRCQKVCGIDAVDFDEEENLPIICHHCGICAKYCPHECLYMKEVGQK